MKRHIFTTILRAIIGAYMLLLCTSQATAQQPPPAPPKVAQVEPLAVSPKSDRERIVELELKIAEHDRLWLAFLAVFGVFVAVFGVAPLGYQIWTARKEQPLRDKVTDLFLRGEASRLSQSTEVHGHLVNNLRDSADTIRLVNDTLMLAKEASSRASQSVERRAKSEMDMLDAQASELIAAASGGNERALIENPQNVSEIESLAERIGQFDIYRIVLDESVRVTPTCTFIKGMQAHVRQRFSDALLLWRQVASNSEADAALRSSAWYWIGYENNNLGRFDDGRVAFEQALALSMGGARKYELRRIAIESEFFDKSKTTSETARAKIEDLLAQATDDRAPPERLDPIRTTAGNISYVAGTDLALAGDTGASAGTFSNARALFRSVSRPSKWSMLGEGQCAIQLGEGLDEARATLFPQVWRDAEDEHRRRKEPRTKTLARFAQLICVLAIPERKSDVSATLKQVSEEVGDVDNRMTVYSLLQRRNVSKAEMMADAEGMVARGTGI